MSRQATEDHTEEVERVFAREIWDTTHVLGDPARIDPPSPVVLPTGVTTRFILFVGEITSRTRLREGLGYSRVHLIGPTGLLYISLRRQSVLGGDLQPCEDERVFVSVVGLPRTTRTPEGTEFVTVYPTKFTRVEEGRLHTWTRKTINRTLERLEMQVDESTREAESANDHYEFSTNRYWDAIADAREFTAFSSSLG